MSVADGRLALAVGFARGNSAVLDSEPELAEKLGLAQTQTLAPAEEAGYAALATLLANQRPLLQRMLDDVRRGMSETRGEVLAGQIANERPLCIGTRAASPMAASTVTRNCTLAAPTGRRPEAIGRSRFFGWCASSSRSRTSLST